MIYISKYGKSEYKILKLAMRLGNPIRNHLWSLRLWGSKQYLFLSFIHTLQACENSLWLVLHPPGMAVLLQPFLELYSQHTSRPLDIAFVLVFLTPLYSCLGRDSILASFPSSTDILSPGKLLLALAALGTSPDRPLSFGKKTNHSRIY